MKKRWMILAIIACLVTGLAHSFYLQMLSSQSTAHASSHLDEQIKQYEESLKSEENTFVPYSQTSQENQRTTQSIESQNINGTNGTAIKKQVNGVGHNNISKLGQDVGDALKTVVREVLRSVIKFFDQLISE
ncbi:MAG: hypothetical protein Q4Q00_01165 [Turicibacter sp.]|nr:hypothetical protein [Turicibacter sp.]